jgi:EAL domain-containing protein (putative c-di-GMP-specific phosphodiesterase class I)
MAISGASHLSIRFYTRLGVGVVLLLAGGVGGWASVTEIAGAVIALAKNLGLSTVAEGVETAEQAAELARLGAEYLQGFTLAQPMTGHRTAAWYAAHAR